MRYLNKHIFPISILAALLVVYFITRIYNLTGLPIFTDEAIYIRWAQIANNDAAWRFISLTDGKQPSYVWAAMVTLEFIKDPLFAGRFVSVIAGFFSLIGIFLLGRETFKNTHIGLLVATLYAVYPFALLYDRMALYDSMVAMFIIWSLYFTILLIRHIRLDIALILGMIIGGGMLTKTSANFGFILLPFSLLLFPFKKKFDKSKLALWGVYAIVAFLIANSIYAILRLSPFFHIVAEKNLTFVYSFSEWIYNPFAYVFGNLDGLTGWLIGYMTIPFLLLVASSFIIDKKFLREKLLLLVWFIVPFVGLAFFGRVIYPRFILFMTMPLLVLGGYALYQLLRYSKALWLKALVILVFIGMWLYTDFYIITNFEKAPVPNGDRSQLYTAWSAGGGIKEIIEKLEAESIDKKIYVGTEGTFGLLPYALEIYLQDNPNIKIQGFWPIENTPPNELIEASKEMPTYVIFYQSCPPCEGVGQAPTTWPLKEIYQYKKIEQGSYTTLYQLESK